MREDAVGRFLASAAGRARDGNEVYCRQARGCDQGVGPRGMASRQADPDRSAAKESEAGSCLSCFEAVLSLGRVEIGFQPEPADCHTTNIVSVDGPGGPRGFNQAKPTGASGLGCAGRGAGGWPRNRPHEALLLPRRSWGASSSKIGKGIDALEDNRGRTGCPMQSLWDRRNPVRDGSQRSTEPSIRSCTQ